MQLNSDQLHAGIRALAKDVVDEVIHWKLSRGILEAAETWPLVIQQSNTFWQLTITAHAMCQFLQCVAYSIRKRLRCTFWDYFNLLRKIYRSLMKHRFANGCAIIHSLHHLPSQPVFLMQRNTALAHLSQKRRLNSTPPRSDEEITNADFENLLSRAVEIVNRYSSLFGAEHFSTQVVGHDDYKTVFLWVQERVELERAKWSE
jgi:hypothetical protein